MYFVSVLKGKNNNNACALYTIVCMGIRLPGLVLFDTNFHIITMALNVMPLMKYKNS